MFPPLVRAIDPALSFAVDIAASSPAAQSNRPVTAIIGVPCVLANAIGIDVVVRGEVTRARAPSEIDFRAA